MDIIVFIFLTLFFLSLALYIFIGLLLRGNIVTMPAAEKWQPLVSVVIAAKNEEFYIAACLRSLAGLDYPPDKLDIIIVDDDSTDASPTIIKSFVDRFDTMQHIRLSANEKEKPGKAGALLAGIEKSRGDIIFITDADCTAPASWIHDMLKGFRHNVGVVGGFTLLEPPATILETLQTLDWHYLQSVASAASQLNKPITWVGNNLAVRRSAYVEVGGYGHLGNSFVEDFALIDAIERQTAWQCRFYASPKSIIRTHPARTLRELYAQRKRWGMGIAAARSFGWWIMLTGFITHLVIFAAFFMTPILAVAAFAVKIGIDGLILQQSSAALNEPIKTGDFILFELYYMVYSIIFPILMLLDRRTSWKGVELKRD